MNKPVVFGEQHERAFLFVDPRVADWRTLARDVPSTTRIVVLDLAADGVTQIAAALCGESGLAAIGASLRDGGDILVYGCEVGQGKHGRAFIERLADATGASVAASSALDGPVGPKLRFWPS